MPFMAWRFGRMKGYWIVRCEYHDQEAFELYAKAATEIVAKNDGKFLVRGADNKPIRKMQNLKELFWLNFQVLKSLKQSMLAQSIKRH